MSGRPQGQSGTQAFLQSQGGIPIKEPLIDNTPVGDFWVRSGPSINISAANVPFTFAIQLPRIPSVFFYDVTTGAVCYATQADRALWSPQQIVLRATISTILEPLIVG